MIKVTRVYCEWDSCIHNKGYVCTKALINLHADCIDDNECLICENYTEEPED